MAKKKNKKKTRRSSAKPQQQAAEPVNAVATLGEPESFADALQEDGTYRQPKAASRVSLPLNLAALADTDDGGTVDPEGSSDDGASRQFAGQANSGQVFDHWWYGKMALDMDGLEIPSEVQPVLLDHRTDKILGQTSSIKVAKDKSLQTEGEVHAVTQYARDVLALMDKGVPYQMSVYIPPKSVEWVDAGAEAQVNGHTLTGPGVIYRQATLREVTITALGQDPNTAAALLSRGPTGDVEYETLHVEVSKLSAKKEEGTTMSRNEDAAEDDRMYTEDEHQALLSEAVDTAVTEAIDAERARLSAIDDLVDGTGMPAEDVARFKSEGTAVAEVAQAALKFVKDRKGAVLHSITERDQFSNDEGDTTVDTSEQQVGDAARNSSQPQLEDVLKMEHGEDRFGLEFDLNWKNCQDEFSERDDYIAYRDHTTEVEQRA